MDLIEKLLVASTLMVELIEREVIFDPELRYIFFSLYNQTINHIIANDSHKIRGKKREERIDVNEIPTQKYASAVRQYFRSDIVENHIPKSAYKEWH